MIETNRKAIQRGLNFLEDNNWILQLINRDWCSSTIGATNRKVELLGIEGQSCSLADTQDHPKFFGYINFGIADKNFGATGLWFS